jgi:leucyl aminopeptidase (aminopeptidase T)
VDSKGENHKVMAGHAARALEALLRVRPGCTVLVVADPPTLAIGRAFHEAAVRLGAAASLYELPAERPIRAVPPDLRDLLATLRPAAPDLVILNILAGIAEEAPMRVALIEAETALGARVGHAPGIDEAMMTEGPMSADYAVLAAATDALTRRFDGADRARLTGPGGTDLTLCIRGRGFQSDLGVANGAMGNLPAGEIWCAPVEDSADGLLVCDGSIGGLGRVERPVRIELARGRIDRIGGGTPELRRRLDELLDVDEAARVIGELGIGLNPGARITGNLLEDEKACRTAHLAFGYNLDMPGGRNGSKTHRDFLFHRPTLEVEYAGGRRQALIAEGDVLAES